MKARRRRIMSDPKPFNAEEARLIGDSLGIDWRHVDLEQFRMGLFAEHEYVTRSLATHVTEDELFFAGRIALAYLREYPRYYTRHATLEVKAVRAADGKTRYAP
jgi:hypothetical protein